MSRPGAFFSVTNVVQGAIALLITVLLAVVGFFSAQTYSMVLDIPKTQATFQEKVLDKISKSTERVAELAGDFKATVRQLASHEDQDRQLREVDQDVVRGLDRRLLTIERNSGRSGMVTPLPQPRPN